MLENGYMTLESIVVKVINKGKKYYKVQLLDHDPLQSLLINDVSASLEKGKYYLLQVEKWKRWNPSYRLLYVPLAIDSQAMGLKKARQIEEAAKAYDQLIYHLSRLQGYLEQGKGWSSHYERGIEEALTQLKGYSRFKDVVQLRKTYQDLLSCRDDQLLIANLGYLEASAKQGSRNDNALKTIEELLAKRRKRKQEYLSYERRVEEIRAKGRSVAYQAQVEAEAQFKRLNGRDRQNYRCIDCGHSYRYYSQVTEGSFLCWTCDKAMKRREMLLRKREAREAEKQKAHE